MIVIGTASVNPSTNTVQIASPLGFGAVRGIRLTNFSPFTLTLTNISGTSQSQEYLPPQTQMVYTYVNVSATPIISGYTGNPSTIATELLVEYSTDPIEDFLGTYPASVPGASGGTASNVTVVNTGANPVPVSGAVTISGTPTVDIGTNPVPVSGNVGITGTPAVTISGTPTVDIGTNPVPVSGNVGVTGTLNANTVLSNGTWNPVYGAYAYASNASVSNPPAIVVPAVAGKTIRVLKLFITYISGGGGNYNVTLYSDNGVTTILTFPTTAGVSYQEVDLGPIGLLGKLSTAIYAEATTAGAYTVSLTIGYDTQ